MNGQSQDNHRIGDVSQVGVAQGGAGAVWNQSHNAGYIARLLQARDIYGNIYFGDVEHLEPTKIPQEYQDYLQSVYVPPDDDEFERFKQVALRRGYGYLVGEPGSGREIAAVALLAAEGFEARHVLLEAGELDRLRFLPQERERGYIIDLSNFERPFGDARKSLMDFWYSAKVHSSVVLVVLRPEQARAGDLPARPYVVFPSPGQRVFASHLEHLTGEDSKLWESREDVSEVLESSSPEQAVRLARIAAELHDQHGSSISIWASKALAVHGKWGAELEDWFERNKGEDGVWNRIVLTACAMLEGVDSETVLISADRLAERLGAAPNDAGGLLGSGVASTLRTVSADLTDKGEVRFDDYQYGASALDYIWVQHPRLRQPLLDWSTRRFADLDRRATKILAGRWAQLVMRQRANEWVNRVFNTWAKNPRTMHAAVVFGSRIASAAGFGQRMRSRLYDIATDPKNPVQARTVAHVCQQYGRVNPTSALVRLRRLASTDNPTIQGDILLALGALSEYQDTWSVIIREVVGWAGGDDKYRVGIAKIFLLQVLESSEEGIPDLLHGLDATEYEAQNKETIVLIWRTLLESADDILVARAAEKWFNLVLDETPWRRKVDEILLSAIRGKAEGARAEVTLRTVTANRAVGLWCERHKDQIDERHESVLNLHSRIHRAGNRN